MQIFIKTPYGPEDEEVLDWDYSTKEETNGNRIGGASA